MDLCRTQKLVVLHFETERERERENKVKLTNGSGEQQRRGGSIEGDCR